MVSVQLRAGQFALLFPEDGHAPSCAWDAPAEVLKVVVKVMV
jgi:YhcH/YjgK/YiaL family protein